MGQAAEGVAKHVEQVQCSTTTDLKYQRISIVDRAV